MPSLSQMVINYFNTPFILINITYTINVIALLLKDILWLRSIMMVAQTIMIAYSLVSRNYPITVWNSLFFTINSVQVFRLLLERRPINMPDELKDIYANVFSVMGMREFLSFWSSGTLKAIAKDEDLCVEGGVPNELMLVVNGNVSVVRAGKELVQLNRGSFIAEMSFMTGEPASASVKAVENDVEIIAWNKEKLKNLKKVNADLMMKVQVILGKDLTHKLMHKS